MSVGPSSSDAAKARSRAETGTPSTASTRSPTRMPASGSGSVRRQGGDHDIAAAAARAEPQAERRSARRAGAAPPAPPPASGSGCRGRGGRKAPRRRCAASAPAPPGAAAATRATPTRTARRGRRREKAPRLRAAPSAEGPAGCGRRAAAVPAPAESTRVSPPRSSGRSSGSSTSRPRRLQSPRLAGAARSMWRSSTAPRATESTASTRSRGNSAASGCARAPGGAEQEQQDQERRRAPPRPRPRRRNRRGRRMRGAPPSRWNTRLPVRGSASASRASTACPSVKRSPVLRPTSARPASSSVHRSSGRDASGTIPLAPFDSTRDEEAEACHPRNARIEVVSDLVRHVRREVAVHRVPLRRRGAPLGAGDVLADVREALRLGLGQPVRAETEAADQRPMHQQVGVAADRAGEMGVARQGEAEMADVLRAVGGLGLAAQHRLVDQPLLRPAAHDAPARARRSAAGPGPPAAGRCRRCRGTAAAPPASRPRAGRGRGTCRAGAGAPAPPPRRHWRRP